MTEHSNLPETAEPEEAQHLTKSDIWFDDGNIIIQAEHTLFRIHRGVLESNSTIFKDMFFMAEPEAHSVVDGCPVVHVTDISQDWNNVLNSLYYHSKLYDSIDEYPMPVLLSMLRLGKKYIMEHTFERARGRLLRFLPEFYDDWEQESQYSHGGWDGGYFGWEADIINTLETLGLQTLLPKAYYMFLRRYQLEEILCGIRRPDAGGSVVQLSQQTQRAIIFGREHLLAVSFKRIRSTLHGDRLISEENCSKKESCNQSRTKCVTSYLMHKSYCPDAMLAEEFGEQLFPGYGGPWLCSSCKLNFDSIASVGKQEFWDNLPTYFNLPKWEDLKDLD